MRNNQIKGAVTELVLMEIAEGLSSLMKNPDLSEKISAAYAFNESERQQLEEARNIIATADDVRAQLEEKAKEYDDIGTRIEKEVALKRANEQLLESVKQERQVHETMRVKNENKSNELQGYAKELDKKEQRLAAWQSDLEVAQQEIDKQRAEIKNALDKYKNIFGGLVENV